MASCFLCAYRAAGTQVEELACAHAELTGSVEQLTADKDKLVPQLEQARWHSRQLERKLEDLMAAKQSAEQVRGSNPQHRSCSAQGYLHAIDCTYHFVAFSL